MSYSESSLADYERRYRQVTEARKIFLAELTSRLTKLSDLFIVSGSEDSCLMDVCFLHLERYAIEINHSGSFEPPIVASFISPNGTVYTSHLRIDGQTSELIEVTNQGSEKAYNFDQLVKSIIRAFDSEYKKNGGLYDQQL